EGMPHLHAAYWANTQAALAQGVMGSPTYVLDGDMFYGQDRLEMLAQALTQPFAPHRWQNPSVDQ
ncbi:MAG: DsbA family protein, partial [Pseudomonadota bacterium]